MALKVEVSILPEELSTRIMFWRLGTAVDWRFEEDERSGIMSLSRGTFDRGGLYGSLVSALRIRWVADKWVRAEITCLDVNAGFSGTWFRY